MRFESLPNEVIIMILNILGGVDASRTFGGMTHRLKDLVGFVEIWTIQSSKELLILNGAHKIRYLRITNVVGINSIRDQLRPISTHTLSLSPNCYFLLGPNSLLRLTFNKLIISEIDSNIDSKYLYHLKEATHELLASQIHVKGLNRITLDLAETLQEFQLGLYFIMDNTDIFVTNLTESILSKPLMNPRFYLDKVEITDKIILRILKNLGLSQYLDCLKTSIIYMDSISNCNATVLDPIGNICKDVLTVDIFQANRLHLESVKHIRLIESKANSITREWLIKEDPDIVSAPHIDSINIYDVTQIRFDTIRILFCMYYTLRKVIVTTLYYTKEIIFYRENMYESCNVLRLYN